MNNSDMPAMPSGIEQTQHLRGERPLFTGLSKREHFAGLAMQGLLVNMGRNECNNEIDVVNAAIYCADQLLKELDK